MLGDRIAALRRQSGLSQRELAALLEISPSTVGMYEQNRREPSVRQLVRLADRFEVTLDYLLTGAPRDVTDAPALRAWAQELQAQGEDVQVLRKDGTRTSIPPAYIHLLMAALLPDPS